MSAAFDARKSTAQNGGGDDEKSVTRQVEHAKAYAIKRDGTVPAERVYVANGTDGSEGARPDSLSRP